jgi:hypothetical protein
VPGYPFLVPAVRGSGLAGFSDGQVDFGGKVDFLIAVRLCIFSVLPS